MNIEPLEARIAPASAFVTYTDLDGDSVKITATKAGAAVAPLDATDLTFIGGGAAGQLATLNLTEPAFDGASVRISVVKAGAGDGLVAVGHIAGGTNDFGTIAIKGDLGDIDAGSNTAGTPAIKSLSVRTMGRYGLATQGGGGDLLTNINGALGAFKVAGDVKEARINVFGGIGATLGSVTIGGSLIGGAGGSSGSISTFSGDMGLVKIGHDVLGGSGPDSGAIIARGKLAGVTIGGSLIGASGEGSGSIGSSLNMGAVKVAGDIQGGDGPVSGRIGSGGNLVGVTVRGSLFGGAGDYSGSIGGGGSVGGVKIGHDLRGGAGLSSGSIVSFSDIGVVTIGHSVQGGAGGYSGRIESGGDMGVVKIGGDLTCPSITTDPLFGSGSIESFGRIARVNIGGSIIAGSDNSPTRSLILSATIRAADDIGAITVKGSLMGSVGIGGDITKVVISARGQALPTSASDVAIGKISIGGRVERAQILAGYSLDLGDPPIAANGNAQIGAVAVGGDWVASDLIAGVADLGAVGFGDASDAIIGFGASTAKIASIKIKGIVVGTAVAGDRFGFESHAIGSFKVNGVSIPIVSPVPLSPITGDVTLRLV